MARSSRAASDHNVILLTNCWLHNTHLASSWSYELTRVHPCKTMLLILLLLLHQASFAQPKHGRLLSLHLLQSQRIAFLVLLHFIYFHQYMRGIGLI